MQRDLIFRVDKQFIDKAVLDLDFSIRCINYLRKEKIELMKDLDGKTYGEILDIVIHKKSLSELHDYEVKAVKYTEAEELEPRDETFILCEKDKIEVSYIGKLFGFQIFADKAGNHHAMRKDNEIDFISPSFSDLQFFLTI